MCGRYNGSYISNKTFLYSTIVGPKLELLLVEALDLFGWNVDCCRLGYDTDQYSSFINVSWLVITYQTTTYHSPEQCFRNLIWKVGVSTDIIGQKGLEIETTTYGAGKEAAVMSGKWQRVSSVSWPPGLAISEF